MGIGYLTDHDKQKNLTLGQRCLVGILPCLLVIAAMGGIVERVVFEPFDESMVWSSVFLLFLIMEQGTLVSDYTGKTVPQWSRARGSKEGAAEQSTAIPSNSMK